MSDEQTNPAQLPSLHKARRILESEKTSHNQTDEFNDTHDKENATSVNSCENKGISQKRPKGSVQPRVSFLMIDNKSNVEENSIDDIPLEERLSSDLQDDDLSQGAPLSIKNFFKAVKTFSKRVPKNPKPRPDPIKATKEAEVVVFERSATPRGMPSPTGASRSLPPILDFHEIVGPDRTLADDLEKLERLPRSKTDSTDSRMRAIRSTERQSSPEMESVVGRGLRSELLSDLAPDGLQEFGSIDEYSTVRRGGRRKSRKSLAILYKQLDEHETLHF